jgi:hypothetical protein
MKKFITFCILCIFSLQAMSMGFPHSAAAAKRVSASNKVKMHNSTKMNIQKAIEEAKPSSLIQKAVTVGQKILFYKLNND